MAQDQTQEEKQIAEHYMRRHQRMKDRRRVNWESNWEDVAEFILPRKDDVFGQVSRVKGERKYNRLFDSTSIHANETLASSLSGMLIPQTQQWLAFATGDPVVDKEREARLWMQDAATKILSELDHTNFYTEAHETFLDLGAIGTNTMFVGEEDEKEDADVFFNSSPIYGYWISVDKNKRVSVISFEEELTFRELVGRYGEENLSGDVLRQGRKDELKEFTVVRFVEPNEQFDPDAPQLEINKPFVSVHILKSSRVLVKKSGFNEMPFAVPRWTVSNNEVYGRSPGMKAMPDIKMINSMAKVNIRGAQKAIDPPLQVPDNGFLLPLDTTPGGTNFYRQGMQDRIEPLQTGARPDIGQDLIESHKQQIRQAFFIDQLQLREGPQMTATEVRQRTEEQLRLMGPILARLNDEFLKPLVDRVFGIMLRKGRFNEPPESLKGRDLQVRFISQVAKAQKASAADTLPRVIQSISPIVQAQPEVMDNFDGDNIVREHAEIFGLSETQLKDPEDIKDEREERQARQKQQQAAQQAKEQSETAKNLGQAQQ